MERNIRKDDGDNVIRSNNGIVIAIVTGLFALIGVIYRGQVDLKIEQLKETHEKELHESQNDYEQYIYNRSSIIQKNGIEYVQYEFETDPPMEGYHMIAYPFAICEKEDNKVYLPIIGQFNHDEYVADEDGKCSLLRENTTGEFLKMAASVVNYSIEVECLIAIQYVKDGKVKREVYDIRDGQLTLSDQNIVIEVLKAWEDEDGVKIDMWAWPHFNQQLLEGIFD